MCVTYQGHLLYVTRNGSLPCSVADPGFDLRGGVDFVNEGGVVENQVKVL